MEPILSKDDIVEIISKKYKKPQKNDIIVYLHWKTNATMHRIMKIDNINGKKIYYTKGDANKFMDNYTILDEEIIGVVIKIIRISEHESVENTANFSLQAMDAANGFVRVDRCV